MTRGLGCPVAHGLFPDQESNPQGGFLTTSPPGKSLRSAPLPWAVPPAPLGHHLIYALLPEAPRLRVPMFVSARVNCCCSVILSSFSTCVPGGCSGTGSHNHCSSCRKEGGGYTWTFSFPVSVCPGSCSDHFCFISHCVRLSYPLTWENVILF